MIVLVIVVGVAALGAAGLGGEIQPVSVETEATGGDTTAVTEAGGSGGQEDGNTGTTGGNGTQTPSDDGESGGETSTDSDRSGVASKSLTTDGQAVINVQRDDMSGAVDGVMPGDRGSATLNVTNEGNASGSFRVTTANVTDSENGRTEPELGVDDTGGDPGVGNGELSSNLLVRWVVIDPATDDPTALTDGYVPIDTLDGKTVQVEPGQGVTVPENGTATALFEWKVPKTTGNEIQSDSVTFDVDFTLISG